MKTVYVIQTTSKQKNKSFVWRTGYTTLREAIENVLASDAPNLKKHNLVHYVSDQYIYDIFEVEIKETD